MEWDFVQFHTCTNMQQLFLISDNDSLSFKWVCLCVWASVHACLCRWGTDFSLVSQTAHGHRIPISIKRKKKNKFVCLCASIIIADHLSLVHFDTVVSLNLLFACLCVCVCSWQCRSLRWSWRCWSYVQRWRISRLERQRTAPAGKVQWSLKVLTCVTSSSTQTFTTHVHAPTRSPYHMSSVPGCQWDMSPKNRLQTRLEVIRIKQNI